MRRYASSFNPSIWKGWNRLCSPPPSPDVGVSALCTHLFPSLAFHRYHFMLSFFPPPLFLRGNGVSAGLRRLPYRSADLNNEEFKPLLSHLSGFVADQDKELKRWKWETNCVCVRKREKKSWLMFVCSCTYSVCAHYMLYLKLTDIGNFTYMSFSIQPEKIYRFLRCAAFSKETLFYIQ